MTALGEREFYFNFDLYLYDMKRRLDSYQRILHLVHNLGEQICTFHMRPGRLGLGDVNIQPR